MPILLSYDSGQLHGIVRKLNCLGVTVDASRMEVTADASRMEVTMYAINSSVGMLYLALF